MLLSSVSLLALAQGARAADAAADAQDIVVTAPRQESKARAVQLDAPNLISVQSAETIAKYPDFNAAESLGRMPGISLSTDTGEGRFINIRGLDGNLNGATFGGVPLLNTNPGGTYFGGGGRAVEFDTIPTGSVDGLIVTYTGLPDHDAEGLGGTVELTPRTAANISKPFIDGALGWGYEPAHDHTGPFNADLALGLRFGFENGHPIVEGMGREAAPRVGWISNPTPFSLVATASRRDDRRGFDDIEEEYNNAGTSDRSYKNLQLRQYDYHRRRFGYGGEFDFKPNDDHRYYVRANVAGYVEAVKKNRLTYDFSDDIGDTAQVAVGSGYTGAAAMSIKSADEQETHRNQVYVVGGQDHFDQVALDYRASYSRATFNVGKNYGTSFTGPTVAAAYNNSANNGDFPVISVTNGVNINDPSLYTLKKGAVSNSQEHDIDEEHAYAANLSFPVHLLGDQDQVKFGTELRFRTKSASPYAQKATIAGGLNLANASSAAVTDFYDGRYSNGPQVNTGLIRDLAAATLSAPAFDPTGYFNAREDIYAGYVQYTAKVGKWGLLAGVRVEATDAKYGAYSNNTTSSDGGSVDKWFFVSRKENYTNVFPTVQVRYDFTPKLVLRATYSTGIGRPGFSQNTAASTSNYDTTDLQISTGNPNLKPTTGNNFDLSMEYYLPNAGIIQFVAFDKEFSNYIVTEHQNSVYAGPNPSFVGYEAGYTTYANVSSAYARGIEVAYHQQFQWLPKPLDGFGIESNLTLVDSRIREYDAATSATGHDEYGLLPGSSRVTANLAGFYEAHGVQARISSQYVSKELFSLGGSKAADTIQDNRLTVDFAASYDVTSNVRVYFNAKNLTNEPLRFYSGNSSFPGQREFYDVTVEGGVKFHF
ncbi:MAG: TonB-dependent receptor [Caulobacteraceae bacterium]|nr:TonB-dependent receptor [Caulobacteraceae bacterium]